MVSESMSDENLYLVLLLSAISNELPFVVKFVLLNSHWNDSNGKLNTAQLAWKLRITSFPSTPVIVPVFEGARFAEGKAAKNTMFTLNECLLMRDVITVRMYGCCSKIITFRVCQIHS